jgi:hypothetical protein
MMSTHQGNHGSDSEIQRRPYVGSCHCGFTRYVCWLKLPASPPYARRTKPENKLSQVIRKCNCTICHKTGFFHLRMDNTPEDFVLLSPLDPRKELSDYRGRDPDGASWLFCSKCGVYCFILQGPENLGVVGERDLAGKGVDLKLAKIEGNGRSAKVWVPNAEVWKEEQNCALRVNAMTLESGQDGLDLREWKEKGWIEYSDALTAVNKHRYDVPHEGGTY